MEEVDSHPGLWQSIILVAEPGSSTPLISEPPNTAFKWLTLLLYIQGLG
jgi:hypothetical protein